MEIYVGNIPPNIKSEDLRSLYHSFGTILFIDIKNRCKPPFAFILFDNAGSAKKAAMAMNGYQHQGYQFQVKLLTCNEDSVTNKRKSSEKSTTLDHQRSARKREMSPVSKKFKYSKSSDSHRKVA